MNIPLFDQHSSLLHLCPLGRFIVLSVDYLHCQYFIAAMKAKPWQASVMLAPALVHLPDLAQSTYIASEPAMTNVV